MKKLGALMTAMVTPFTPSGDLDANEAARLAEWLVMQGNDGVIVGGTTGESPALAREEKLALFGAVKERLGDRGCVVAGSGGNDTRTSVALTKEAERIGVDGILAVVPYYNKPPQDGMLMHFGAIAEATSLPVIVYNIPNRTGANLLPATLRELARRHANIVGVKESSGDFSQFTTILRDRAPDFTFWCGDDYLFLPSLAIGGEGLISVAGHLCARQLREMLAAYRQGDSGRAAQIHRDLAPLFTALFSTTSPIPIKWAVNALGFKAGPTRLPLGPLAPEQQVVLERVIAPFVDALHAST